jgi:hypothetical protein
MLPLLAATGVGSLAAGNLFWKLKNASFIVVVGATSILLGTGLLTALSSSTLIPGRIYGFQVVLGLDVGMIFSSISITVSPRVDQQLQSGILGIASQSRLLGGSIGVTAAKATMNWQATFGS